MDLVMAFGMGVVAAKYAETRSYLVSLMPQAAPLVLMAQQKSVKTLAKCKRHSNPERPCHQDTCRSDVLTPPTPCTTPVLTIRRPKAPEKIHTPPEKIESHPENIQISHEKIQNLHEKTESNADLLLTAQFGNDWTQEPQAREDLALDREEIPEAIVEDLSTADLETPIKPDCSSAIALDLLVSNRKDNHESSLAEETLVDHLASHLASENGPEGSPIVD